MKMPKPPHVNASSILIAVTVVSAIILLIGYHELGTVYTNLVSLFGPLGFGSVNSAKVGAQPQDPFAPCNPPATNPVVCENTKQGAPASQWDISGAGDANIQGFATDISVNRGETVRFKIQTDSNNYRLDIYRIGYYGGSGARLIATVRPSASLPQVQPPCFVQLSTGLIDCGAWAESASWAVPSNATSGIYIAKLVREDGAPGASHIAFIVRDDSGGSDLLFQTSDTTWQAYNSYGGNSLYEGAPAGRAYKVSYNRPFNTRGHPKFRNSWLFDSEYPMARWLEANGYNVSYFTGIDADRRGAEILKHKVFLSVGHDEYWSAAQRANVEAARDAGVHLAFFSGNIMFWKTRWENSIDGSETPYRTLVCYKETHANAKIDPLPDTWTGTWRDPRFNPPADGGKSENAVTGTIFAVNCCQQDEIKVPEPLGKFRFWRNTTVANQSPGQTATVGPKTVGYEWDEDLSNGFRPSGLIRLSSNTVNVGGLLLDYGTIYGIGSATHSLTLYRHNSGAMVFSAATVRWSWGLDDNHDINGVSPIPPPDSDMRQATVNLLADMGVQPAALQSGLEAESQSTDTVAPTSTITFPTDGATLPVGFPVDITGIATDNCCGLVAAVNVSVDGGGVWSQATGTDSWSYRWTPIAPGTVTIMSRSVDDSGNAQSPVAKVTITVFATPLTQCPCSLWGNGVTPTITTYPDAAPVEPGMKFQADVDGWVTRLRFYKGATNTGSHIGRLWAGDGTLLATATYGIETAEGWQEAALAAPVAIKANTTYLVSYHTNVGFYAVDTGYFSTTGVSNPPLRALSSRAVGGNGVFQYGAGGFPMNIYNGNNFWVDVVFTATLPAPTVIAVRPAAGAGNVRADANVTATFNEAMNAATVNGAAMELRDPSNAIVPATVSYDASTRTATLSPASALTAGTTYTARIRGGDADPRVKDVAGAALDADVVWTFTTVGACPCSLWGNGVTPTITAFPDAAPVELGMKFQADVDGWVTRLRFYKGATNIGSHIGRLWTSDGTPLATVTFSAETAEGWQEATLAAPVAIKANTTYVVSYHTNVGFYAVDTGYFSTTGVSNPPLRALASGAAPGNGVFQYGAGDFPSDTYNGNNFWVDVVFIDSDAFSLGRFSVALIQDATRAAANGAPGAVFSKAPNFAGSNRSTAILRDADPLLLPTRPAQTRLRSRRSRRYSSGRRIR